ncbi:MAG: DMT family transporter, partial [Propionibacteriales bacterium]|nr:DMT family transporter [Propionibacteriales bacterium]
AAVIAAVVFALGAAACFAISTSLQHRSVTSAPSAGRAAMLLRFLARRPAWLLGLVMGGVGFALHALAVRTGALALVQPLMVSGMVFAVAVRAALDRHAPSRPEVAWAAVVAIGLGLFVVVSDPVAGVGVTHRPVAGLLVAVGVTLVVTCMWSSGRASADRIRGLLLGSASGILFGLVAGALKMSVLAAADGSPDVTPMVALVILGVWGVFLNQRAYQLAPLSVSMPIQNIVNVLVAIAFGFFVFDEIPAHRPEQLVAEVVGLALMGIGVRRLAKDPELVPSHILVEPR